MPRSYLLCRPFHLKAAAARTREIALGFSGTPDAAVCGKESLLCWAASRAIQRYSIESAAVTCKGSAVVNFPYAHCRQVRLLNSIAPGFADLPNKGTIWKEQVLPRVA